MKRIVIFGTAGSGKSWLGERLAAKHGLYCPHCREWIPNAELVESN